MNLHNEYSNSELEEMGLPVPCACPNMMEGWDWRECPDCGSYEEFTRGLFG